MSTDIAEQVKQAVAKFKTHNAHAVSNVEKTVLKYALVVEGTAKRLFKPRGATSVYNEPPRVDTGRLRASITHRASRSGEVYTQEIGTNVEYASDVEFGTSNTMPHPFLGYAFGMYEKEIEQEIAKAVKEAENA